MKCFTVINDLVPFNGINVCHNDRIGIFGNFCSLADGKDQAERPTMIEGKEILGLRLATSYQPIDHLILEAGVIKAMMGVEYPVITAPNDEDPSDSALVYWAINTDTSWGIVVGRIEHNGGVTLYDQILHHQGYEEILFSVRDRSYAAITFHGGPKLLVRYSNKKLEVVHL